MSEIIELLTTAHCSIEGGKSQYNKAVGSICVYSVPVSLALRVGYLELITTLLMRYCIFMYAGFL